MELNVLDIFGDTTNELIIRVLLQKKFGTLENIKKVGRWKVSWRLFVCRFRENSVFVHTNKRILLLSWKGVKL